MPVLSKWSIGHKGSIRRSIFGNFFCQCVRNELLNSIADGDGNKRNGNSRGGASGMARPWGITSRPCQTFGVGAYNLQSISTCKTNSGHSPKFYLPIFAVLYFAKIFSLQNFVWYLATQTCNKAAN